METSQQVCIVLILAGIYALVRAIFNRERSIITGQVHLLARLIGNRAMRVLDFVLGFALIGVGAAGLLGWWKFPV